MRVIPYYKALLPSHLFLCSKLAAYVDNVILSEIMIGGYLIICTVASFVCLDFRLMVIVFYTQ